LFATSAAAAEAPAELRNKTITAFWIDDQQASFYPGEAHRDRLRSDLTIYVSSIGRVFTRHGRANAGNGRNTASSIAPDSALRRDDITTPQGIQFEGGKRLSMVFPAERGARRALITFDAGYRSCSIEVIYGREGGSLKWQSFGGRMQDILSIRTVAKSCAIRSGNLLPES